MNYQEYLKVFEDIINGNNSSAPYDSLQYVEYARLNLTSVCASG